VAVVTNDRIGIRSDYNGILLLGSILQSPITTGKETVEIELSKTEVFRRSCRDSPPNLLINKS